MAEYKDPDQAHEAIYRAMPAPLADVYRAVASELQDLCFEWNWFNVMYGDSEKNVEVLNRTARGFFGHMEGVQIGSIILHVAKLLDPPSASRRRRVNASLSHMARVLGDLGDAELAAALLRRRRRLRATATAILAHRSRRIAHADLAVVVGQEPLPGLTRVRFEVVLEGLAEALNKVSFKYQGSQTIYQHGIEDGGAKQLLFWLSQGLAHKECRLRELECLQAQALRAERV